MTTTLFDKWTTKYDCWFETQCGILVKQYESELLLKLLNPLSGEKILDVGCGTGVFTIDVIAQGSRITGIDISEPMLRKAIHKIGKIGSPVKTAEIVTTDFTGICADMCVLPFADNSFDKVLSMTAIEFIEDANKAVAELDRVTRQGGTIVLTTLNSLSPWAEQRRKAAENGHDLFQKIFFRSPDEMRSLVPANPVVKTAIHFQKEDCLSNIPEIERQGKKNNSDKGAFLAVKWKKT
ncbi:MAG: class I SAM-dependent methyltransferase [Desulfobacula sp.]|jgi:ubiquinone/menaquinone biosynthesis C-methylase UbiE|nr:class I SAM-dependent methyltransferase [Desulfobacula sp.]